MKKDTSTAASEKKLFGGFKASLINTHCHVLCFCFGSLDKVFFALAFLLTGALLALTGDFVANWPACLLGAVTGTGLFVLGRMAFPMLFDVRVGDFLRCRLAFLTLGIAALLTAVTSAGFRVIFDQVCMRGVVFAVGIWTVVGVSWYLRHGKFLLLPIISAVCGALCVLDGYALLLSLAAWGVFMVAKIVLSRNFCGDYYDEDEFVEFLHPVVRNLQIARRARLACVFMFTIAFFVMLGVVSHLSPREAMHELSRVYAQGFTSTFDFMDCLPHYLFAGLMFFFALNFARMATSPRDNGPMPGLMLFMFGAIFLASGAWYLGMVGKLFELLELSKASGLLLPDILSSLALLVSSGVFAFEIARMKILVDFHEDEGSSASSAPVASTPTHPIVAFFFAFALLLFVGLIAVYRLVPSLF